MRVGKGMPIRAEVGMERRKMVWVVKRMRWRKQAHALGSVKESSSRWPESHGLKGHMMLGRPVFRGHVMERRRKSQQSLRKSTSGSEVYGGGGFGAIGGGLLLCCSGSLYLKL